MVAYSTRIQNRFNTLCALTFNSRRGVAVHIVTEDRDVEAPYSSEVQAQQRAIVDTLSQSPTATNPLSDHIACRNASRDAAALAEQDPEFIYPVAPTLIQRLNQEVEQPHGSRADRMFKSGMSEATQGYIVAALSRCSGPVLSEIIAESDTDSTAFISSLERMLTTIRSVDTQLATVRILNKLSWQHPDQVPHTHHIESQLEALVVLVTDEQLDPVQQAATGHLLSTILSHSSNSVTAARYEGLRQCCNILASSPKRRCQAYGELITAFIEGPSGNPHSKTGKATQVIITLSEEIQRNSGYSRRERACIAGELCWVLNACSIDMPYQLLERLTGAERTDRRRAATAVGEFVAANVQSPSEGEPGLTNAVAAIVTQINEASVQHRSLVTGILGEVVAAYPDRFESLPTGLVERIDAPDEPEPGEIASVVGESALFVRDDNRPLQRTVRGLLLDDEARSRFIAATVLGHLVTWTGVPAASKSTQLIGEVEHQTGTQRRISAYALGEVVLAESTDRCGIATDRISTEDNSSEQDVARLRAIGEITTTTPATVSSVVVPSTQRKSVRQLKGEDRHQVMIALGTAALHEGDQPATPSDALVQLTTSTTGDARKRTTRLLGEWTAAVTTTQGTPRGALVTRVGQTTDEERRIFATLLGLVTYTAQAPHIDPLLPLASRLPFEHCLHEVATDALATTLSRSTELDREQCRQCLPREFPLVSADPQWIARNVGEWVSHFANDFVALDTSLREAVDTTDYWHREGLGQALGEASAIVQPSVEYACEIPADRAGNIEPVSRHEAYVLGEIVTACRESCESLVTDVPTALAERIEASDGDDRSWPARALGYIIIVSDESSDDLLESLSGRVDASTGDNRTLAAVSLGEFVIARSSHCEEVPDALRERMTSLTGRERKRIARAIGEVIATDDPATIFDRILEQSRPVSCFDHDRWTHLLGVLVENDLIEVEDYVSGASRISSQSEERNQRIDIDDILSLTPPVRDSILDALDTLVSHHNTHPEFDGLDEQITRVLVASSVESSVRVQLLNILVELGPPPLTRTPKSST